jgi:hypothetical protein
LTSTANAWRGSNAMAAARCEVGLKTGPLALHWVRVAMAAGCACADIGLVPVATQPVRARGIQDPNARHGDGEAIKGGAALQSGWTAGHTASPTRCENWT